MEFEAVIGLEVHSQLLTDSKLFCGCSTRFGAEPNTQVCPLCLGMPGVLPVLNRKAVEFAVKTALAVGCRVNPRSIFARKNYFYPDLPKGYQISQYTEPLAEHGHLDIETSGGTKRVGITRIHMEEDAGKLLHGDTPEEDAYSFVDLNRASVPLIEIVSEPDIRTPEEAQCYMKELRDILVYLGVCSGNMEEGSLRCDANVSVRPVGTEKFGTRAELKNLNSFKYLKDAIEYEIERQIDLIRDGGKVVQETRLYNPATGLTASMRSKEEAHDYRYFPEPDLTALDVADELIEEVRSTLPELPAGKRARFVSVYGIPAYDAGVLTSTRELADYYEEVVRLSGEPKTSSNWVMGELLRLMKETNRDIKDCAVKPEALTGLIDLIKKGEISGKIAKEVFEEMFSTGAAAADIVKKKGMTQISDTDELRGVINGLIEANSDTVERYRAGEEKLLGFFVGQAMKATKGKANPQVLNDLLKEMLAG